MGPGVNLSDRAVGTVLEGRYRLEARLSNWGVGEVWRAADAQRPKSPVTVKILAVPSARRTERTAAIKLVCDRVAKLQHPCVLPIVEANTAGAQPFVVYEAWEGTGLGDWLTAARATAEPTALRTVFALADRILQAIGAGHRQRAPGSLVHGAVHHEAVRVRLEAGREPEVRVLDFGLAAEKESSALAALVDASPSEYGAPEHAREPALRNPATDVFAASVLVLRLLVPDAVRPRGHRNWGQFVAQREGEVHATIAALRPDVHPEVWEALAQGLARRPEARPPDAERLREMLRAATWSLPSTHDVETAMAPVVPMELPSLAPPVAPLAAPAPPTFAPVPMPVPASMPAPAPVARSGPPAGPPPVPKGMQLGVAAVLGANRPGGAPARPRRSTAGVDGQNFGPSAPTPRDVPAPLPSARVSVDDAQATRLDLSLPADEPATFDTEPPTMAAPPSAAPRGAAKVSLDQADRTVQSPFEDVEPTQMAVLPVPRAASVPVRRFPPSDELDATWVPGPAALAAAASHALVSSDATMPLSPEDMPREVTVALAGYGMPVNPASWDTTSNLQPVSYGAAPAPPAYAAPSAHAARPADPFALVAAAGRGDARAWDASTTPPDQAPAPARAKTPVVLLVCLALLAAAVAFLVGMLASSHQNAAPPTVAPVTR